MQRKTQYVTLPSGAFVDLNGINACDVASLDEHDLDALLVELDLKAARISTQIAEAPENADHQWRARVHTAQRFTEIATRVVSQRLKHLKRTQKETRRVKFLEQFISIAKEAMPAETFERVRNRALAVSESLQAAE